MELVALYWMHGVDNTFHGFLKMSDSSSIAFVQHPDIAKIQPIKGVSHAGSTAQNVAPGVMQHLALNVDTYEDLLAIRDRVRSHGHWIMGPLDHGFCKSIYLAAPEGIMLEFSTSEGNSIDAEAWIDPEVMALAGISPEEVEKFKHPAQFESKGGKVAQPKPDPSKPLMDYAPDDFGDSRQEFVQIQGFSDCGDFQQKVEKFAALLKPDALPGTWCGHIRPRRPARPRRFSLRSWCRCG